MLYIVNIHIHKFCLHYHWEKENSLDHGMRLLVRQDLIRAPFICPTIVQLHNIGVPMKGLRHSLVPKLKTTAWKKGKDITPPPPSQPAAVPITLGVELQRQVIRKTISYTFTSQPENTEMLDECWPSADLNSQCLTINIWKSILTILQPRPPVCAGKFSISVYLLHWRKGIF